ncbi:beta family protein [Burkholderia cepacia]|uniref:beta family protein n=1 Tax=Burkholderia cepacia TaxID=292 RepID=UPI001CF4EFCF|nr:beta family protein [Burkholderia cepacia]MCA7928940.1 beta family protein [Burkholderia cepacia]
MSSIVYVPFVKGKENDIKAVGSLAKAIREITKPLIEIIPINPEKPDIDKHVHKFCRYIKKFSPLGEIFVDFHGLLPDALMSDGTNSILFGYSLLRGFGREVTPVYGFDRNDNLWPQFGKVVASFGKGFAFRLGRDDLADYLFDDTWAAIVERSGEMALQEKSVDLILDFGNLSGLDNEAIKENVISFLFHNPRAKFYRSIIVSSSSALKNVGEIEQDEMTEVTRHELHLWSQLWNDMPDEIKPIYGDYGVIHSGFSDVGPNQNMNAKIRYTVGDKILYFRGHGLRRPKKDYAQYYELAKQVVADDRYRTRNFSYGDTYLDNCARRQIKPGTPSTWILADMSHHMTYVARQVDRLIAHFVSLSSETVPSTLLEEI